MSKVVLITGGSSGIGKAIGNYLAKRNFKVYGTSRNPKKFADFDDFSLLQLDVTDEKSIMKAVSVIIAKEEKLDVLINNAGVGITGAVEETPTEEINNAFETNVYGPIRVMKAVLPQMRKQKQGVIINITSIAGYMGLPYRGIYSATKAALEVITEATRMEVKDFGIEMTNIAPGDFDTNIASGRYHTPIFKDSAYKIPYENVLNTIDAGMKGGANPKEVAQLVYKIINKKKPKIHYKIGGFMEKFSIVLKRILPDRVYEKLLINHYKL